MPVMIVIFEPAELSVAQDANKLMRLMKKTGKIRPTMQIDHFVQEQYYPQLRGEYVHKQVQDRHIETEVRI